MLEDEPKRKLHLNGMKVELDLRKELGKDSQEMRI